MNESKFYGRITVSGYLVLCWASLSSLALVANGQGQTFTPDSDEASSRTSSEDFSNSAKNIDGGWFPEPATKGPNPSFTKNQNSALSILSALISQKSVPKPDEERDLIEKLQNLQEHEKPQIASLIKQLPPITPSDENPRNATEWDRFQVKLESVYRNHLLTEQETFAHPSVKEYPGVPEKPADPSVLLTHTLQLDKNKRYEVLLNNSCHASPTLSKLKQSGVTSCAGFCPTTIYAEAGRLIRISFGPDINKVKSFSVRIGHFTLDTSNLPSWTQYPNMKTLKTFTVNNMKKDYAIHSVFGGLVYLGNINHEIGLKSLSLTITGGVKESPSFIYREVHLAEWREDKQILNVPWGDLVSPQVTLTLPHFILQKISNPEDLLVGWEKIVDGINEVAQLSYKESRVHIAAVRELPNGVPLALPGAPLFIDDETAAELTESPQLWEKSTNMYGILHALAHNFQHHFDAFGLIPPKGEPAHNEIIVNYIKNVVHLLPMEQVRKEYKLEKIQSVVTEYMKEANLNNFLKKKMALTWYFDLQRNFGWTTFMQLAKIFRGRMFSSNEERIDALYIEISKLEGKNLKNYFSSWGLPASTSAQSLIQTLPDSPLTIQNLLLYCTEQLRPKAKGRGFSQSRKEELPPLKLGSDGEKDNRMEKEEKEKEWARAQQNLYRDVEVRPKGRTFMGPGASKAHLFQPPPVSGDYAQLTYGMGLFMHPPCLQLSIMSEGATPILWGMLTSGNEFASVGVTAAVSQAGSRAVLTGCSYMMYGNGDPAERLLANVLMWVGKYSGNPSTFRALSIETNLTKSETYFINQLVRNAGLQINVLQYTQVRPEAFYGVNVLIVRSLDYLSEEVTRMIENYLQTGGGIFANVEEAHMVNTDFPAKRIAKAFGVVFTGKLLYQTKPEGYEVGSPKPSGLTAPDAAMVVAEVLERDKQVSLFEERTVTNTLELALTATSGQKAAWKDILKRAFQKSPSIVPNHNLNQSVKVTESLRRKLTLEEIAMQTLEPEDNYKHPAADMFPGPVNPAAYKGSRFSATLRLDRKPSDFEILREENCLSSAYLMEQDVSCTDWCPTGFYVPAGAAVKITFDAAVSSFAVFTGRFENVLRLEEYQKYPKIEYARYFKTNTGVISSPFGGPLMLGHIKASRSVPSVNYTIEGAAEMPHFFLGQTRLSEWPRLKKLDTPWFIISGQNKEIKFPKSHLNELENPEALTLLWDRMLDAFNEFHETPYRKHKEWLNFDVQLPDPWAYMMAGNISARYICADTAISVSEMRNSSYTALLFLHELGHNWELQWWKLAGGYQVTNEINQYYVKSSAHGLDPERIHDKSMALTKENPTRIQMLDKYLKSGPNYEQYFNYKNDSEGWDAYIQISSRLFYLDLGRNFGWSVFMKMAGIEKSQNVSFSSDEIRRDWSLEQLSLMVKRDLTDYFASWGMRTSQAAQAKVRHLRKAKETVHTFREYLVKKEAARQEKEERVKVNPGPNLGFGVKPDQTPGYAGSNNRPDPQTNSRQPPNPGINSGPLNNNSGQQPNPSNNNGNMSPPPNTWNPPNHGNGNGPRPQPNAWSPPSSGPRPNRAGRPGRRRPAPQANQPQPPRQDNIPG